MLLNKKEKKFCEKFLQTGSFDEAQKFSGVNKIKKDVFNRINKLYQEKEKILLIRANIGYERLAFGNVSDALKLMMCEKIDLSELKNMDLFCVSEIKRPREGAIEFKFFDRIRALEKLENIYKENENKNNLDEFYKKITENFKKIDD